MDFHKGDFLMKAISVASARRWWQRNQLHIARFRRYGGNRKRSGCWAQQFYMVKRILTQDGYFDKK